MKLPLLLLFFCPIHLFGQNVNQDSVTNTPQKEKAFAVVPLITSTPLMGVGVGLTSSYLYQADASEASKSQLRVGGQYSTTKSYNIFATNNLWLKDNKVRSLTMFTYSSINNNFKDGDRDVDYNINSILISKLIMFRVSDNFYLGGPVQFKHIKYKSNNQDGEDFIAENGIINETTGGFGGAASYDNRANKYYPTNSVFLTARFDLFPEWLGSDDYYHKTILDARGYLDGFSHEDVLAMQAYGEYASTFAPDAGLPSISGKAILRGFPHGQFKARFMTGGQVEYRYTIGQSRFRMTGFFGMVNLAGGSYGDGENSRNDDGWYNAFGLGARYKIQPVSGVDVRLDVVRTSIEEIAIYLKLNQAF